MSDNMELKTEPENNAQLSDDNLTDVDNSDAEKVMSAKLNAFNNAISDKYTETMAGLSEIEFGSGYQKADRGLLDFFSKINDLELYACKTANIYLKGDASNTGADDITKSDTFANIKSIVNIGIFANEFGRTALDIANKEMFKLAFTMIRLDKELGSISDRNSTIIYGFNEYNTLRVNYGNAEIIKELKLRKSATPEENYDIAKNHLNAYIGNTQHLKTLLSSGGTNDLFIIDRLSCAFKNIYAAKDSMKGCLESAKKLLGECDKLVADEPSVLVTQLVRDILISIISSFETALKLIEDYASESSKTPYALVHYDLVVKDVADRWLAESLPDPLSNGTRYSDLIRSINKSWDSVLRPIAKNAEKWGLD